VEAAINIIAARCRRSVVTKPGMEHDLRSRYGDHIRVITTHVLLHCLLYIGFVCYKKHLESLGAIRSLPRQYILVFILRKHKILML
jgi:hypothetical protein